MIVVVPVFLGGMVSECLETLRAQQADFDFEILVVDDASPDDSWSRIQQVAGDDGRRRVWRNPENWWLAWNICFLLGESRGKYIAYIDGDDVALPGKLQTMARYLDEHPCCAIVYHGAEVFDHDTRRVLYHYSRDHYNARYGPSVAGIEHLVR